MSEEEKNGAMALRTRPPAFGLPTGCPRCLPLLIYMRLANAAFRVEYSSSFPDSDDLPIVQLGPLAGFSSEPGGLEEFLRQEGICDLDADVQELDKPDVEAFKSLVRKLQDALDYEIWSLPNEQIAAQIYTSELPWPLTKVIEWNMRRKVMERLNVSKDNENNRKQEIYREAFGAYEALSTRQGTDSYFLREKPTSLDAYLLAHLLFLINVPLQSQLKEELNRKFNHLVRFASLNERVLTSSTTPPEEDFTTTYSPPPRPTPYRGSASASSSRRGSKAGSAEPKRQQTPVEKEFTRKGKLFLCAQLVAAVGFLLIYGLDTEYEE